MTTTATTNYGWVMPNPGTEADNWGNLLNATIVAVDAALHGVSNVASAANSLAGTATPTGAVMDFLRNSAPDGWLALDGSTIGNGGSSATHAGAAMQALFVLLWNSFSDAVCPVVGGRGASAADDWTNGKRLTLVDQRGRFRRTSGGDAAAIGVVQGDEVKAHTHGFSTSVGKDFPGNGNVSYVHGAVNTTFGSYSSTTASTGGSENRPVNIAYLTCIKV